MDARDQIMSQLGKTSSNTNSQQAGDDSAPVDMDALLNQSMDSIPDIPDFVTPKEGAYGVGVEEVDLAKEIGDNKAIQVTYVIAEVYEVKGNKDARGDDCKAGDKFSEMYFMTTAKGAAYTQGHLKKLLKPIAEAQGLQGAPIGAVLKAMQGMKIAVLVEHQKDKKNDRIFAKVAKIVLL